MAIVLAQKNSFMQNSSASSTPCTYVNAAQTVHNANVVYINVVSFFGLTAPTVTSVTDTSGNTYTQLKTGTCNVSIRMDVWVCSDIAAAAISTNVVTAHYSGVTNGEAAIFLLEYSGLVTSSITDGTAVFSTGTGVGNQTSAAITTTNANDVLVAGSVHRTGGGAPTFVSPFVNEGPILTTTDSADQIVSATGSYSATITGGSSGLWGIILVALKGRSAATLGLFEGGAAAQTFDIPPPGVWVVGEDLPTGVFEEWAPPQIAPQPEPPVLLYPEEEKITVALPDNEFSYPAIIQEPPWIAPAAYPPEEFKGSPLLEEQTPIFLQPFVDWIAPAAYPPEEFAGFPFIEEGPQAALVAPDLVLPPSVFLPEEFAGSLPLEEVGALVWQPVDVTPWLLIAPEEEFAGAHPTEEAGQPPWVGVEAAASPPPAPEEFAGSLPLEEPPASTWVAVFDQVSAPTVEEEFGGSHPTEEVGSLPVVFDLPPAGIAAVDEGFAGSLPAEESSTWAATFVETVSVAGVVDEEFAGSLPLEEPSTWVWVAADQPTGFDTTTEEFAGSLPLEEPSVAMSLVSEPDVIATGDAGEAFIATGAFEESSAPPVVFVDVEEAALSQSEEIAQPTAPPDEYGLPWIVELVLATGAPSIEEEFAFASIVDEWPAIAALVVETPTSTQPSVDEGFAGPYPIEEPGLAPWIAVDATAFSAQPTDEPFAPRHPMEETGAAAVLVLEPDVVAAQPVDEVIAGRAPFDEAPGWVAPPELVHRSWAVEYTEDIARATAIVEEEYAALPHWEPPPPFIGPQTGHEEEPPAPPNPPKPAPKPKPAILTKDTSTTGNWVHEWQPPREEYKKLPLPKRRKTIEEYLDDNAKLEAPIAKWEPVGPVGGKAPAGQPGKKPSPPPTVSTVAETQNVLVEGKATLHTIADKQHIGDVIHQQIHHHHYLAAPPTSVGVPSAPVGSSGIWKWLIVAGAVVAVVWIVRTTGDNRRPQRRRLKPKPPIRRRKR